MTPTFKQVRRVLAHTNQLVGPMQRTAPKAWDYSIFSLSAFMWRAFQPKATDYRAVMRYRRATRIGFALMEFGLSAAQRDKLQHLAMTPGVRTEKAVRDIVTAATAAARPVLHLPMKAAA